MPTVQIPATLHGAKPTVRLVWLALEAAPRLTIADLVERTGACESAVKQSLAELVDSDLVERHDHPVDDRRTLYSVVDSGAGEVPP